jgi:hypothetical protein
MCPMCRAYRPYSIGPILPLGIAIPGQFPNPGIRDWRARNPGIPEHNAHVIRASNPGPTFSIPGFGIETFNAGIPTGRNTSRLADHNHICRVVNIGDSLLLYRRYYRRYFFSIGIGIADTFVAMYRFEYRQYFLTLNNVDTFSDTFAFEFA